jgi:uncharacterized protein DUF6941
VRLAVAVLADSAIANPQDRKLYILGGGISMIGVQRFPGQQPALSLALAIEFAPPECGRQHTLEVHLLDPDGKPLIPALTQQFVPQKNPADPTLPNGWQAVINYQQLQFQRPGDNAFSIVIDGQEVASLPLRVFQIPAVGSGPASGPPSSL